MNLRAIGMLVVFPVALAAQRTPRSPNDEWNAYGHDATGSRFSPLVQITAANVSRLAVAWTYRTGEIDIPSSRAAKLETTPLFVDGLLFVSTPWGKVVALDPVTGAERWKYDAQSKPGRDIGDFVTRGVSTWSDASRPLSTACHRRIFVATTDARLIALDAKTGTTCSGFGTKGTVDLSKNLVNGIAFPGEYSVTSPPAILGGLVIVGSSIGDNNRTNASSGVVRAYDARTGEQRWSWDPVPRDSTDKAWESWYGVLSHSTGAANAWSVFAADSARGLVFVPTSSPSPDYYGGERGGANRYANSIVALHAATGKVSWSFQAVHHDLWDYDVASPPSLVTITHDGKRRDVVLQAVKTGQLFVLDRDTGEPVFPVEERAVPKSSLRSERAWATQPFNTVLPSLSPQSLTSDDAWGPTPSDRESCVAQIKALRNEGIFTPPSLEGTLTYPSNVGGPHWGGLAFDRNRELAFVPVNRIASMVQLFQVDVMNMDSLRKESSRLDGEITRMHGTPYTMFRRILTSPSGAPCTAPPFGSLVAIDLKSGTKAWEVPLGDVRALRPGVPLTAPAWGSPNLGGPIVTASGIVFIAATFDPAIRAFDAATGALLWTGKLPAGARATPMTYQAKGKQYLTIAVGGSDEWGKGDYFVTFALP